MRVALVHDYLLQYGGAERVLQEFAGIFPTAPIYTLAYDEEATGYAFKDRDIRTSFLQKVPKVAATYKLFPMLMPLATESLRLQDYDLILSSSASFSKGIIAGGDGVHICYCHTPMRYVWFDYKKFSGSSLYPSFVEKILPLGLPYVRLWDKHSAQRPDHLVCNSKFIQKKIKKYYSRDATVINPPVNSHRFYIDKAEDYFLMVGRMVPYKRFDLAIRACEELGLPLKIIGDGPGYKNLKAIAGSKTEFLGLVSENELAQHYAKARALIFPQEEDFGITALESMASGRPVVAYKVGGALEIIKEGETGVFFEEQTVESLKKALKAFGDITFDPQKIRQAAEKFDRIHFREKILAFVEEKLKEHKKHFTI